MSEQKLFVVGVITWAILCFGAGIYLEYSNNERIKACEARGYEWRNVSKSDWKAEFTCIAPKATP